MKTDNKKTFVAAASEINKIREQCIDFIKLTMRNDTFFNNSKDTDIVKQCKIAICTHIAGLIDAMCNEKNLTYTDIDIDTTVEHFAEIDKERFEKKLTQSTLNDETDVLPIKPSIRVLNQEGGIMQTFRVKLLPECDEEVIADTQQQAVQMAKQQLEEKLYNGNVNFVNILQSKAVDAETAEKIKRI